MRTTASLAVVCVLAMSLVGCGSVGPCHTSESGFLEQVFLPSELEARTAYYEKKGMSNADAMRKAYGELDRSEKPFYSSEAAAIKSREISREDIERWSKDSK